MHHSRLKHFKSKITSNQLSRMEKKNMDDKHVIGFPMITTEEYCIKSSPKAILPSPTKIKYGRLVTKMMKLGKSMDILAQGLREHVRLGPKLSEMVKGKLSLGVSILRVGGVEKVLKQSFDIIDGEKLLTASQCYLSTTVGPIAGLLFVSTQRLAFCSHRSIKISSPTGNFLKLRYKVMIPLGKIKRAVESEKVKEGRDRYVEIITVDNFEFWLMGFLSHESTLRYLHQAIRVVG